MLEYVTARGTPALARWNISGAGRGNTSDGRLWFVLAQDGSDCALTLFRDQPCTLAVASGARSGPGALALAALNDSGLSGSVELAAAAQGRGELDVFYACDADLTALARDVEAHLSGGQFAGGPGFLVPCAGAKRVLDALLRARLGPGFVPDSLAPLAEVASLYALSFLYEWLAARPDDAASTLAGHFRARARAALPGLRLPCNGQWIAPFASRLARG